MHQEPIINYYPHHIGDYAKDTRALSQGEHGAYRLLMDEAYSTEEGIAQDEVYAITCAKTPQEKRNADRVIAKFFVLQDGRYRQKRIDVEVRSYQEKSAKASASAQKRWSERNANASANASANAMRTHSEWICESDAKSMLPITNNQKPITNNQKPITNNQETKKNQDQNQGAREALSLPDWVPKLAWEGWLAMRKAKRTPNTPRALTLAVAKLDSLRSHGEDPARVLDQSTERGWTGLFPTAHRGNGAASDHGIPGER